MASSSRTPSKAQLENTKLEAEIRRHNAAAELAELKALDEHRLQEEHEASAYANHVYHFIEPVYGETVAHCVDTLALWSRLDPGCDLTIVLNSPGGLVYEGLALYDALEELKLNGHKLTIIVRGIAASMGAVLLQVASEDERVVGRNAHVMIHELSDTAVGKHSDIKDATKFNERLNDRLMSILAKRSTMTKQRIKARASRRDWWLDSDECLDGGFADRIG